MYPLRVSFPYPFSRFSPVPSELPLPFLFRPDTVDNPLPLPSPPSFSCLPNPRSPFFPSSHSIFHLPRIDEPPPPVVTLIVPLLLIPMQPLLDLGMRVLNPPYKSTWQTFPFLFSTLALSICLVPTLLMEKRLLFFLLAPDRFWCCLVRPLHFRGATTFFLSSRFFLEVAPR